MWSQIYATSDLEEGFIHSRRTLTEDRLCEPSLAAPRLPFVVGGFELDTGVGRGAGCSSRFGGDDWNPFGMIG